MRSKLDLRPEAVLRRDRRRRAALVTFAVALAGLAGSAIVIGLDRLLGP